TAADPGEMITEVWFPRPARQAALTEFAQRQGDFAIVAAAVSAQVTDGTCDAVRVVLGGVGTRPLLLDTDELAGAPAAAPPGRGRFTGDFTRPGMLHAAFARSPFAAAAVGPIDAAAALELPGVAAVFTAADLGRPFLRAVLERDEFVPTPMPMLAGDEVRFAGEPVAVVLADDPYLAEDAAELLDIDWTPWPAITGIEAATADGARQVHQELTGNCMVDLTMFESESLPGIFAAAPVIVGGTFTSARVAALPMEGRACGAEWDARDDQLVAP